MRGRHPHRSVLSICCSLYARNLFSAGSGTTCWRFFVHLRVHPHQRRVRCAVCRPSPPSAHVHLCTPRPPCLTNALSNEHFRSDRNFWDLINYVLGLGNELLRYRTACPTNIFVRTVFFEDFVVRWARGGMCTRTWLTRTCACALFCGSMPCGLLAIIPCVCAAECTWFDPLLPECGIYTTFCIESIPHECVRVVPALVQRLFTICMASTTAQSMGLSGFVRECSALTDKLVMLHCPCIGAYSPSWRTQ